MGFTFSNLLKQRAVCEFVHNFSLGYVNMYMYNVCTKDVYVTFLLWLKNSYKCEISVFFLDQKIKILIVKVTSYCVVILALLNHTCTCRWAKFLLKIIFNIPYYILYMCIREYSYIIFCTSNPLKMKYWFSFSIIIYSNERYLKGKWPCQYQVLKHLEHVCFCQ